MSVISSGDEMIGQPFVVHSARYPVAALLLT